MLNKNSKRIYPRKYHDPKAELAIKKIPEEAYELDDEQSEAILELQLKLDLIDEQLESVVRNLAIGGIRIISF